MATPIDELLITVEVEQGSKLEELYNMLKEFQSLGGKLEVDVDLAEISQTKDIVVSAHEKINDLTNILIPIVTKYPTLLESIQNLINENFEDISKDINSLLEWKEEITTEMNSTLTNIQDLIKTVDILSQNINKFKNEDFYKKVVKLLNELTKNIKTIFQEQIFDEIKNKLDDLRQQVDKTYFDEISGKIDNIINKLPEAIRAQIRYVTSRLIKQLQTIDEKVPTIEEIEKAVSNVFSGMDTGDYHAGSTYGLDENDVERMLSKVKEEIINHLKFFMSGQAQVNKKILDGINDVKQSIGTFPLTTADLRKTLFDVLSVLNTIKTFVYTGEFKPGEETFRSMSNALEEIRLNLDLHLAKISDVQSIEEAVSSLRKWLSDKMITHYDISDMDVDIGSIKKTIEERIPKSGGWPSMFGKALTGFKDELEDKLTELLGESLDDWVERQEAMGKSLGGGGGDQFLEELEFIKGMLNEVAQYVVIDWIDELGTLTRQMLQITEEYGESVRDMGGDYNTLLHHYLRQDIKIDRFTNLLGKKIEYEKKEFADLQQLLYNFDIPEKFEVLHEKIDNLTEILGVPGGVEEIIGGVNYIWEKIQKLLRVLRRNEQVLQVLKEIPNIERMGPTAESLETLMKILSTAQDVREALLMWRGMISGARAGLRNISHISQIVETKRVLELQKINVASRSEDISNAIEDQIIRPYFKVWKEIDKNVKIIDRKVEDVRSLEEQNLDKDSMNKTKLKE